MHGLEQVPNFRDCVNGWAGLAPGRMYRGATPANATPADVEYLVDTLGIKTLIDLRSTDEAGGDVGDRLVYHRFSEIAKEKGLQKKALAASQVQWMATTSAWLRSPRSHAWYSPCMLGTSANNTLPGHPRA